MGIYRTTITKGQKPSAEQLAELERSLQNREIILDDPECPGLTDKELAMVAAIASQRREERKKKNISLRIPESMINQAKQTVGKGYTSFFSRLLELAYQDKDLVKQCL